MGEQQRFTRTISGERWFEFTTAGDGLAGNSIVVTPGPSRSTETSPLGIARAEIPGQYENAPIAFSFELSNALANAENASQNYSSTGLQFQYDSYAQIPLTGLDLQEKAVASVLLPDGSTTEVLYFVHGGQLAYTDGTLGNVARVGEPGTPLAMNPSRLRSRGSELFYLSNDLGAGTNSLNVLSGPTDSAVTLYESSPGNQIVQYLLQDNLIVARTQQGEIVRINLLDLSLVQVPGNYPSISEMAMVGSTLYFANSSMFLQTLELASAANTTPTILGFGWFQSLTSSRLDGGTLFFQSGQNLWRSNGTVASTTLIKDVAGPSQSLFDINGRLFFAVDYVLWTSDGTTEGTVPIAEDSDDHPLLQATSLASVNGRLYFSGSRTDNRFDVYIADSIGGAFTVQQVAALGIDTTLGMNSEATNFTGVGSLVYFSTRESMSTYLYKMDGTASGTSIVSAIGAGSPTSTASQFMSLNGRLAFQFGALNNEFYLSDGTPSGTRPSQEAAFLIGLQKGKAVGYISEEDATREKYPESLIALNGYSFQPQLFQSSSLPELHDGMVDSLERGVLRVAMNLTPAITPLFPIANVTVSVNDFRYNGDQNKLTLNPVPTGVVVDLLDDQGRILKHNASAIDLRSMAAGRYFLRARTLGATEQTAAFTFVSPAEGQTQAIFYVNDRDKVVGGDGNDTLIGNDDVDQLIGGPGEDIFRGDAIEARDNHGGDTRLLPEFSQSVSTAPNVPTTVLDPIIFVPDNTVRLAVAKELKIPVNVSADLDRGFELSRPIRSSDLATLVTLDLSRSGANSLEGLQYAINLRHLNISYTSVSSLSWLTPGESLVDRDGPLQVGTPHLETLAMDNVWINDMTPLQSMKKLVSISNDGNSSITISSVLASTEDATRLRHLSLDNTNTTSIAQLASKRELRVLSLNNNSVAGLESLSELPHLTHLYVANNQISSLQSLTRYRLIDSGTSGYTEQGPGWLGDRNDGALSVSYRLLPAGNATNRAEWQFSDLPPGLYDVQVTWPEHISRTTEAVYTTTQLTPAVQGSISLLFNSDPPETPITIGTAKSVTINTDSLQVTGDDASNATFFGTNFTFEVIPIDQAEEFARLTVHGDLNIGPDQIVITGSRPLSILVENNVTIADGASIDASAVGVQPGPGGGAPGLDSGQGGSGGSAGEGGSLGGVGGSVTNGGDGQPGAIGQIGGSGASGGAINTSGVGVGFNNLSVNAHSAEAGSGGGYGYNGFSTNNGGIAGGIGQPGMAGSDGSSATAGSSGLPGGVGTPGASINVRDFHYLSAGSAGGAGAGGGGGFGGSGGGSGQGGGQGGIGANGDIGSDGGAGGAGGTGGVGGNGGAGGRGGAGGGAFEITAYGRIRLGASSRFVARGGDGQSGDPGQSGTAGSAGLPGENSGAPGGNRMPGGQGGSGGNGSAGGDGGQGGMGGSGSGGMVRIAASVVESLPSVTVDVRGGNTDSDGAGMNNAGQFLYTSNTSQPFAGGVNGFLGIAVDNLAVRPNEYASGAYSPKIPNMVGGAEVYGLAPFSVSQVLSPTAISQVNHLGAKLAVWRFDNGFYNMNYDFVGHDLIAVMNVSDSIISNPKFGMIFHDGITLTNAGAIDLKMDGYERSTAVTLQNLQGGLQPGQIWLTTVPRMSASNSVQFNVSGISNGEAFSATQVDLASTGYSIEGRWILSNALGTVDQTLPPTSTSLDEATSPDFGGRSWQTLRRAVPLDTGSFKVFLNQSAFGNIAADAVRLVRVNANGQPLDVLPELESLNAINNPLDETNQRFMIGLSNEPISPEAVSALNYVPNSIAPYLEPILGFSMSPNGNSSIPLVGYDPNFAGEVTFSAVSSSPALSVSVVGSQLNLASTVSGNYRVRVTIRDTGVPGAPSRMMSHEFDVNVGTSGVYGTSFLDRNFNGTHGSDEPGNEGLVVYIDSNENGQLDDAEPRTLTDANGVYGFAGLQSFTGNRIIRQILPATGPWLTLPPVVTSQVVSAGAPLLTGIDFGGVRVATVSPSIRTSEGTTVTVQGNILDPGLISATFDYHWEVRLDGQLLDSTETITITTAADPVFSYTLPDNGRYEVKLIVVNLADNSIYSDAMTIVSSNVAPQGVAIANVPISPRSGDALALSASFTDPGYQDTFSYQWKVTRNGATFAVPVNNAPALEFVPNDVGTYLVQLTVTDKDEGATDAAPATMQIANGVPIPSIGNLPLNPVEGVPIQLNGQVNDPGFLVPSRRALFAYQWTVTRNGIPVSIQNANSLSLAFTPVDDGTYSVSFSVTDEYGLQSSFPATESIVVGNARPSASIVGAIPTMNEGSTLVLTRSVTDPGTLDSFPLTIWTVLKNGAPYETHQNPNYNFTPDDNGAYVISVQVTDNAGMASLSTATTIAVQNVAPTNVQIVGLPTSAPEGIPIPISVSLVDSGAADTFVYSWTIRRNGDLVQSFEQTTPAWSFLPNDDGAYEFTLKVRDDDTSLVNEITAVRTLTVMNVAATATPDFVRQGPILEGSSNTLQLINPVDSAADLRAGFLYSFDVDGDGQFDIVDSESNSANVSFPQSGSVILRASIKDVQGASREYPILVQVQNAAPIVNSFSGPTNALQGSGVVFTGTFVDPGLEQWLGSASIQRVGDSTVTVVPIILNADKTFSLQHTFGPFGIYDMIVSVDDREDGTPTSLSRSIVVDNVAPTVQAGPDVTVNQGRTLTRTVSFVDAGFDSWQVIVDYNIADAIPGVVVPFDANTKTIALSHPFGTVGTFQVGVTVFDGLATTTDTFEVVVAPNVAPNVKQAIPSFTVRQGFAISAEHVDLAQVFDDSDGLVTELAYSIVGNTNANLVTPILKGSDLGLVFNTALSGASTITVRATDFAGGFVEHSFLVTVLSRDVTVPSSAVQALPTNATSLSIPITVAGNDPAGPLGSQVSGVREYDLFVAIGSGAYTKFGTVPASNPTTVFYATSNRNYFFRSVARDNVGNEESEANGSADAQISVGDFDPPSTQVTNVTNNSFGLFNLTMTGSDTGGGQLRFIDLYVVTDGGVAELVGSTAAGSSNASGVYTATTTFQGKTDGFSHTYRFFSVGRDSGGNVEAVPNTTSDVVLTRTFANLGLVATGIDVQRGAQQRSYIRYLDVLFSTEDNLSELLALGRVKVERFSLNATNVTPETGTNVPTFAITKVASRLRLDFGTNGITGSRTTNAGDGFYRVLIDVNRDGDFVDSIDGALEFCRILGDSTGDAVVNTDDLNLVNSQFSTSGSNLNGDVDGNGIVNALDRLFVTQQRAIDRRLADALKPFLDD